MALITKKIFRVTFRIKSKCEQSWDHNYQSLFIAATDINEALEFARKNISALSDHLDLYKEDILEQIEGVSDSGMSTIVCSNM